MRKALLFFFRSTPCLFLEGHQVDCPAAQMLFLNENFGKIYRVIPTDLPEKNDLLQQVLTFNVFSVNSR